MNIQEQVLQYLGSLPESRQTEMNALHERILGLLPGCELWFSDGRDEKGKVVANPAIGYGRQVMKYAGGKTKDFYQVGISANKTGISVYLIGLEDKKYLADVYGKTIGKASVTGYCIKFKTLKVIDQDVLDEAILDSVAKTSGV